MTHTITSSSASKAYTPFSAHRSAEKMMQSMLHEAEIEIGGHRPWDMHVHDERLYRRILAHGSLGLGEAYMDGWWDCEALDKFFVRILRADLAARANMDLATGIQLLWARLANPQSLRGSKAVARQHYDLGNDFYTAMLDPFLQYSCGYFEETDDLADAQRNKMDLICRKIRIAPEDDVLDIGCGWGGLAKFMAGTRSANVTGVSISHEQVLYGREFCKGLPVDIREEDYRETEGTYNKIVSVGMFEHVGAKNYRTFLQTARERLRDNGLMLLHTIGRNRSGQGYDPWIARYIFPHSMLPSAAQITAAAEGLFVLEDWHNFGAYYDKTLLAWHENFEKHWPEFQDRYGERFHRMWRYYLLSCAGAFRARRIQLWQIVLSPHGVRGGYQSVR